LSRSTRVEHIWNMSLVGLWMRLGFPLSLSVTIGCYPVRVARTGSGCGLP